MNAHFYFMIIFSFAALKQLSRADALAPSWWLGVVWSGLAFLSMSSASATPLVAIIVSVLQMLAGARAANLRNIIGVVLLAAAAARVALGTGLVAGLLAAALSAALLALAGRAARLFLLFLVAGMAALLRCHGMLLDDAADPVSTIRMTMVRRDQGGKKNT
jgi:uncharacterized protein YacL